MSKYRPDTQVGSLLESFIDEYDHYLSPYMTQKLEEVADDAEDLEKASRDEISDLRSEVNDLKDKIDDLTSDHESEVNNLEKRIQELEDENYELVNRVGE